MAYDLDSLIQDASTLAHVLDAAVDALCDVSRDPSQGMEALRRIDRAESLARLARDAAQRLADQADANFSALRPLVQALPQNLACN